MLYSLAVWCSLKSIWCRFSTFYALRTASSAQHNILNWVISLCTLFLHLPPGLWCPPLLGWKVSDISWPIDISISSVVEEPDCIPELLLVLSCFIAWIILSLAPRYCRIFRTSYSCTLSNDWILCTSSFNMNIAPIVGLFRLKSCCSLVLLFPDECCVIILVDSFMTALSRLMTR